MLPLDIIADPTRLGIVRLLSQQGPSTLEDMTRGTGVHRNTVRHHVAALKAAGIIESAEAGRPGRGRPRHRFRLRGDWILPTTDFRGLAEVLAQVVRALHPPPDVIRKIGHSWGRYFRGRPGARALERDLPPILERLGFMAEVLGKEIRVSGCPCPIVSPEDPSLVCTLLGAVVEGYLAADLATEGPKKIRSARHDPRARSCTLLL